jgi:hypothetical protein
MRVLQTPTCAVFVRQQEVGCHEVTAEHQAAPSAVEADHKIPAIRSVASDSRLEDHGDFWAFPNLGQRSVDRGDKAREIARVDPVVGNVAANNLCDETGVDRLRYSHPVLPPFLTPQHSTTPGEVKTHRN